MRRLRPSTLQGQVLSLLLAVLLLAFGLVGLIVNRAVKIELEERVGRQALNLARAVARHDVLRRYLGQPSGSIFIQPVMEDIRRATGAEFIVTFDNKGIRYSHPVPERIGKHVVGGDEGPALQGKEYVSVAVGTLGTSVRGFAPVYDYRGQQVGAVLVGFLAQDVKFQIGKVLKQVYLALVVGILAAVLGSYFVVRRIKAIMFNMEPSEIAKLLKEREAILTSLHEGLVTVDKEGRITFVNDNARRILRCDPEVIGRNVEKVIPGARLLAVLKTGLAELNREQLTNFGVIVSNVVPIKVKDELVGAVASFRDRTEVKQMADELSGVRRYAEALRTQAHEFRNKLHTIAGFLQLGDHERALNYIMEAIDPQQDLLLFLNRRIKAETLTALLLGKSGRARELGIKFVVLPNTRVDWLPPDIDQNDICTIVANLIENAFEAVLTLPADRRRIEVLLESSPEQLEILVADSGSGVPPSLRREIFRNGFSTKSNGRGIGLALVERLVKNLGGSITVGQSPLGGALFSVRIPWPERVED
ncbi:MAG: two-component system, CitB family, sensor histidine kinase DctS [Moorella sp. (in: firmicutes)]|uniref:ATP-binding protein n=1 Tax=unclassified Neomoorella TaxID=2676739 RepID=UPI0010FFC521|nr:MULTISPECIES: sensor histidine kinase [unclassified Moorella (in: firmicutes)]MDK2815384.1 two-component system, CitB family, sensor histidine kinase DctS [Moorella sp. (in: firmicutes)]MDK2894556.1 two-component system, CitB family, sensor histidine kinase DctS [Moorella sp. (in: firmicutes)]GEA15346.1 two-component system sensor histidine kinase DcuS [Moorella sp. E308F]GEA19793.1 two-component system sensor histidine kinase DcuS [Moorella sp. E306M]